MNLNEEKLLHSTWRSFKAFKPSGGIRLHSEQVFQEWQFDPNKMLTVRSFREGIDQVVVKTDRWNLTFRNRRHYLEIPGERLTYEIITVNHTVLVLQGCSGVMEKTFFARENHWQSFLQSNKEISM